MTHDERNASIVRWLAEKVMGWTWHYQSRSWYGNESLACEARRGWNPLASWDDVGMVWEKAHTLGYSCNTENYVDPEGSGFWRALVSASVSDDDIDVSADSGPRAICEAIALATGWREGE